MNIKKKSYGFESFQLIFVTKKTNKLIFIDKKKKNHYVQCQSVNVEHIIRNKRFHKLSIHIVTLMLLFILSLPQVDLAEGLIKKIVKL